MCFQYIHRPLPESGSRKRFQGSRMRAIDSPHKITYMHIELVSFEPFLARFLSLNKKGRGPYI